MMPYRCLKSLNDKTGARIGDQLADAHFTEQRQLSGALHRVSENALERASGDLSLFQDGASTPALFGPVSPLDVEAFHVFFSSFFKLFKVFFC